MKLVTIIILMLLGISYTKAQNVGFSGMERLNDSTLLVVYDKKAYEDGNRLALLIVDEKTGYSIEELQVKNWIHDEGRPSDLESVCAIPDTRNEFLIVESGYWDGKFGRIFHIKIKGKQVEVITIYNVPSISPCGKSNPDGDNFEGVVCVKKNSDLLILLGERGGSEKYPDGLLRIGLLRKGDNKIDWDLYREKEIKIKAPTTKKDNWAVRSITDLFINEEGVLLASAAVDIGNEGPFRSLVYEIGKVGFKKGILKLARSKNKKPDWVVDGFKIEALSFSPPLIKHAVLSIGTEDENYTGVWRALFRER